MNNMAILVGTIIAVALLALIIRAVRLYPEYKKGIYPELYGHFLWYAWVVLVLQDASVSPYLTKEIGKSHITFSRFQEDGQVKAKFCTIFSNKGIMAVCFESTDGQVRSKNESSDWFVKRTDKKTGEEKTFRHNNITLPFMVYLNNLAHKYKDVHIEARVALDNDSDFSLLKSNVKLVHYSEIVDEIKNVQAEFITDKQVKELFKKALVN